MRDPLHVLYFVSIAGINAVYTGGQFAIITGTLPFIKKLMKLWT